MILWPAVDIRGGHAVRLARGDYAAETVYDADPLDAALRWAADGARGLHVVDLDGARDGAPANLEHVRRITRAVAIPVEVGGGIRDEQAIARVLDAGAERVILGTAAHGDPELVDRAVAAHGDKLVVSVDARRGLVAAAGWTEQTDTPAEQLIGSLAARGVTQFVYSSIERDGMLAGPDLAEVRRIAAVVDGAFVYSGGVACTGDLTALAQLGCRSLAGVIVGTALFEGRLSVAAGQSALDAAG